MGQKLRFLEIDVCGCSSGLARSMMWVSGCGWDKGSFKLKAIVTVMICKMEMIVIMIIIVIMIVMMIVIMMTKY